MIGLDTNVLARYYLAEREADAATTRQQQAARGLLEGGQPLYVAKTVLLELEWVMRGAYALGPDHFAAVLDHLLASPQVTVEDRLSIEAALAGHRDGLDFADALHHAAYRACDSMASFDDRKFGRRAAKLGLVPPASLPG
ncbi:MAG TPA: type II toxin-antitoxin system VapC family toxin [Burkholderiaceae bacterium]